MQRIFRTLLRALGNRFKAGANKVRNLVQRSIVRQIEPAIVKFFVLPVIYSPRLEVYRAESSARKKPCFLVLRYKYCHGDEKFGISNEEHAVSSPLRSANIAETVEYYFDLDYSGGIFGDRKLIDIVTRTHPNLMILSSHSHLNNKHPHFEVLKEIRSQCQIPLMAIWHDSSGEGAIAASSYMSDAIDLNILLDSGNLSRYFSDKENYLRLWAPLDFSVFHPGDGPRDIPISFVGSTGSYRHVRREYLNYLKEQEIDIYRTGGQREQLISLERYAEILRRSRISLNFSYSVPGTNQLKVRVFEILFSGALLMENENSETRQFFTPMVDYVVFYSKEDLLDKVRYYLQHEEERQQIAHNGYMKATQEYNHKVFWNKVMGKLAELRLL